MELSVLAHDLKIPPHPSRPRWRLWMGYPFEVSDDEEFKQQAVAMIRNGQSVRSVAHDLGISENLLHQGKRAAKKSQSNAELEVEQLRQRLKQVEQERDILKKP